MQVPRVLCRAAVLLLVCSALAAGAAGAADRPTVRLSMIPATDPGRMIRASQPLVSYLELQMGAHIVLTVPLNYAAVVEAMVSDKVDIAHFGGFTYVQASARAGVRPLVQRSKDQNFHSVFVTQPGTPVASLADLRGRRFAFGDVNSTSGHLMPEFYMREAKVDPGVITGAVYTGGHDATALAVANKRVDAGAMDELVYRQMLRDGKITDAQVRVFYTTPPFMDYVWAARKTLDPALTRAFTRAFLRLDAAGAQDKPILEFLNATKYVPATDASYDRLRRAAHAAGLM